MTCRNNVNDSEVVRGRNPSTDHRALRRICARGMRMVVGEIRDWTWDAGG